MKKSTRFSVYVNKDMNLFKLTESLLFARGARWWGDSSQIHYSPKTNPYYIVFHLASNGETVIEYSGLDEPRDNPLSIEEFASENYKLQFPTKVPLNKTYTAELLENGIQVGCQFIPIENLTTLFNKLKEENIIK